MYDHAHIGHGKLYISMDIILRYLRYTGLDVLYVQNITDVGHLLDSGEDRIMKGARREQTDPMQIVERYMRSYMDDMDALHNIRPDIMPRAAGHVPEQIAAVEQLIKNGTKEITLLGQNVNAYLYKEKNKSFRLSDLIMVLEEFSELKRIRYTTSHPIDMTDDLIQCYAKSKKLVPLSLIHI